MAERKKSGSPTDAPRTRSPHTTGASGATPDRTGGTMQAGGAGLVRAVIDAVRPCVDGGRFAVKRVEGDELRVEADCFTDGHDLLRVMLRWRAEDVAEDVAEWQEAGMRALGNDVRSGAFAAGAPGRHVFTVVAWVDHFLSWRHEFARREDPEDVAIAAQVGATLIAEAASRAPANDRKTPAEWAAQLKKCSNRVRTHRIRTRNRAP